MKPISALVSAEGESLGKVKYGGFIGCHQIGGQMTYAVFVPELRGLAPS